MDICKPFTPSSSLHHSRKSNFLSLRPACPRPLVGEDRRGFRTYSHRRRQPIGGRQMHACPPDVARPRTSRRPGHDLPGGRSANNGNSLILCVNAQRALGMNGAKGYPRLRHARTLIREDRIPYRFGRGRRLETLQCVICNHMRHWSAGGPPAGVDRCSSFRSLCMCLLDRSDQRQPDLQYLATRLMITGLVPRSRRNTIRGLEQKWQSTWQEKHRLQHRREKLVRMCGSSNSKKAGFQYPQ
jgi:hypothetical protein